MIGHAYPCVLRFLFHHRAPAPPLLKCDCRRRSLHVHLSSWPSANVARPSLNAQIHSTWNLCGSPNNLYEETTAHRSTKASLMWRRSQRQQKAVNTNTSVYTSVERCIELAFAKSWAWTSRSFNVWRVPISTIVMLSSWSWFVVEPLHFGSLWKANEPEILTRSHFPGPPDQRDARFLAGLDRSSLLDHTSQLHPLLNRTAVYIAVLPDPVTVATRRLLFFSNWIPSNLYLPLLPMHLDIHVCRI